MQQAYSFKRRPCRHGGSILPLPCGCVSARVYIPSEVSASLGIEGMEPDSAGWVLQKNKISWARSIIWRSCNEDGLGDCNS
jgi:hypothetical protein